MENKIIIVDYKMGNLGSIKNMLKHLGYQSEITSDIKLINKATKLVLPGVGSFNQGMKKIRELDLEQILVQKSLHERTPTLGICLGMQLMTNNSEEAQLNGLGWFDATTVRFRFNSERSELKIPHMGWNYVKKIKGNKILDGLDGESRFYFVHSYYVQCSNEADKLLSTTYGFEFTSGIQRDNIFGVQFHPEKSHKYGMKILKNFAEM